MVQYGTARRGTRYSDTTTHGHIYVCTPVRTKHMFMLKARIWWMYRGFSVSGAPWKHPKELCTDMLLKWPHKVPERHHYTMYVCAQVSLHLSVTVSLRDANCNGTWHVWGACEVWNRSWGLTAVFACADVFIRAYRRFHGFTCLYHAWRSLNGTRFPFPC